MKLKGRKPVKENSGIPDIPIIAVFKSDTGELVVQRDFQEQCKKFLEECGRLQHELILHNAQTLPQRTSDDFGSKWARENIQETETIQTPDDYIEKYWTMNGNKIEAARLILAYRERDRIADAYDKLGWDTDFDKIKELVSPTSYLDWKLVKNIRDSGKHPELPDVKHPRFPYNQMNNQVCQQVAFTDIIYCHNMAIGPERYDIVFYAGNLEERYRHMDKISRPTMRLAHDGHVAFDFTLTERIPVRDVQRGHVVTFDRNTDHEHIISGARMNADGTISRELGPSVNTLRTIDKLRKWSVERFRCQKKIKNLMPDHDADKRRRLVEQEKHLGELIAMMKDSIDWMEVDDIRCHVLGDEMLGVEQLDMFGGGYIKFRHGSTDDKLEHATARDGGQMVHVNPAGSSSICPVCRKKMVKNAVDGIEHCPGCGYETPHDYGANVTLGERTFKKMGVRVDVSTDALPSVEIQEARSARKRSKRMAKMGRRAARGSKTYRIKDKASPRRPRRGIRDIARGEKVQCCEPLMSLSELRDLFTKGYEACLKSVSGGNVTGKPDDDNKATNNDHAGCLCSVAPLLPWSSTNSFVSGSGWSTCYAFFEDLYVRSMLAGVIRLPDDLSNVDGAVELSYTPLQENLNNS